MNQAGQVVEAFRGWLGTMDPATRWMTVTVLVAGAVGFGFILSQTKLRLPLIFLSWIFFWPLPAGFLLARVIGWRKVLFVWTAGLFAAWGWFKAGVAPAKTLTLVAILTAMVMVFSSYTFRQLIRTEPRGMHDLRQQFSKEGRRRFAEQQQAYRQRNKAPKKEREEQARCANCSKFVSKGQNLCPECDPATYLNRDRANQLGYDVGPDRPGFEPTTPWGKARRRRQRRGAE